MRGCRDVLMHGRVDVMFGCGQMGSTLNGAAAEVTVFDGLEQICPGIVGEMRSF